MHKACQHTAEGEDSCSRCKNWRNVESVRNSNMKSDFNGFMNNVSMIDFTRASVQGLKAFGLFAPRIPEEVAA